MIAVALILSAGLLFSGPPTRVQATLGGMAWYAARGPVLATDIRRSFENVMTPREREATRDVRIRFAADPWPFAFADRSATGPFIEISAGLLWSIDQFSTIIALNQDLSEHIKGDCLNVYMTNFAHLMSHNRTSAITRKSPTPVPAALVFINSRPDICASVNLEKLPGSILDQHREMLIHSSLAFVIAHEFGHIYNDDHPTAQIPRNESRIQERKADQFAMSLEIRTDGSPILALPILLLLASMENFDFETHAGSTHPAGLVRGFLLLDAAVELGKHDPEFKTYLANSDSANRARWTAWGKALERIRPHLEKESLDESDYAVLVEAWRETGRGLPEPSGWPDVTNAVQRHGPRGQQNPRKLNETRQDTKVSVGWPSGG